MDPWEGVRGRTVRRLAAAAAVVGVFASSLFVIPVAVAGTGPPPARMPSTATIAVQPHSGPAGTGILVTGSGWGAPRAWCDRFVSIKFRDAAGTRTALGTTPYNGTFSFNGQIPAGAAAGRGRVVAMRHIYARGLCYPWKVRATAKFIVKSDADT
jgi:hypothetical protein